MTRATTFSLQPFAHEAGAGEISLTGGLGREGGKFVLEYRLQGSLHILDIPEKARRPARGHALWKETCFECFIQPAGETAYWELNLSPAGHWNVYRFDGYRHGMREEPAVAVPSVAVTAMADSVCLEAVVDLNPCCEASVEWKIGPCAVLRTRDGRTTYWALAHPGPQPDFHHPGSLLLVL